MFYKSFGINNTANIIYLVFLAFFSAFTPVVVYFTTKLLTNRRAAVFASLLYFFFLPAIYSTVTFSGGVIYHLLAIAIIYYFAKIYKNPNLKYYIIVGMLVGLKTFTNSEFLLLGVIMLGLSYMINRRRKFEFKSTLLSLIIFCVIVTPWVVRNTNLFGKLVPIVSHPWHEIWRGSNEYATGGAFAKGEIHNWMGKKRYPEIHSALESLEYDQRFEIRADSVYKYHAVQYWKAEPLNSVYLAIKRVLILWSFDPFTPSSMRIIYLIPSCLVSILFFLSLFVLKKAIETKRKDFLYILFIRYLLHE